MTYLEILAGFETEIGLINDPINKPSTDDSLFWLNQAVGKFMKLRFNGDLVHKQGYEQTAKRRADLIKLFKEVKYENIRVYKDSPSYNKYEIKYPDDFLFELNEDVVIGNLNGEYKMNTCVFECTQDSFMYRVNNSLTDFHYNHHKARPIRIRDSKGCFLLTDKKYNIYQYTLGYLRKPKEITLDNPYDEYEDFEDIMMNEIIKIAAQMYIENTKDQRYQTISQEVLTQE